MPTTPSVSAPPRNDALLLAAVASGDLRALADGSPDALAPFLPLLARLESSRIAASPLLLRSERAATLLDLARELRRLQPRDVVTSSAEPAADEPTYRRFECGDARTRACLVLAELQTQQTQQQPVPPSELFANAIYNDELAALLVLALANDQLSGGSDDDAALGLRAVVRFCLRAPLGVELVQRLVENDPSTVERVVDAVVESLEDVKDGGGQLPLELVRARDACVAIASLAPAFATITRDKLSERRGSIWSVAVALHLVVTVPALQDDTAAFLFRMMKSEAKVGAASGPAAHVSAFSSYVSLALADSSELQQQQQQQPSALQQLASQHLSAIRQRLIEGLSHAASPYIVVVTLNVVIGLIVQANFRPSDHETIQLLRWFDKAAKEDQQVPKQLLSSRVVSLAYILVVLLCYPLAPSLNKIPSQREDGTKAILSLSQQCIFSLYNTKASCPLFIITAVLLFTKSPSLLPFLASAIGNDGLPVQALRVDFLHVFGDVVLKPILTENIMAREVLTFAPAMSFGAMDSDILREMTLRGIHGLLCEKSFLRHHHGRALEEWIANQVEHATLPLHPLLLNVLLEWIENYVVAFEYPLTQKPVLQLSIIPLRHSTLTKWLSAACLAERFQPSVTGDASNASEKTTAWCKGVLALAYGLHFNQRIRHAMMVSGSKISGLSPAAHPSTGDVCFFYELSEFPLGNMLREVLASGGKGQAFEFIAPTLLRLMIEEYPHRVEASLTASPDRQDLSQCWVRSRPRRSQFDHTADSWMELSWRLSELETAPSRILVSDFESVVDRILPSILLSHQHVSLSTLQTSYSEDVVMQQEPSLPTYSEIIFAQIARLYENRVSREHLRRTRLKMKLVHAICFPDLVRHHFQQRQQHGDRSSHVATAPSHLVTYNQVVEEPFRLLSDAHDAVFRSPALLRVLLLLVSDFRDAAIAHLKKQDSAQVPRRQQLLQTALPVAGGSEPQPPSLIPKTAAIMHHMLVQDCLIVHGLLNRIVAVSSESAAHPATNDHVQRECNRLLCGKLDALFQDELSSTLLPFKLIVAVHQQGYANSLVPVLVENVPSMRLLWDHWMAQTQSNSAAPSSSSSSSGARSSTQSKLVNEFVAPDGCEKDLERWSFRLRVFFSLCGKYFAPPSQTPVVLQTFKFVLNKLRSVLQAAIAGSSSNASTSAADSEELHKHAAFLDRVLPMAVAACAQHPELSAELVQFLLKLQKQGGGASSSTSNGGSSSGGWRSGAGARNVAPGRDVDDVLREAYALLLQQI